MYSICRATAACCAVPSRVPLSQGSSRRGILRDAWRIARPYWFSEERWVARGLLATLIAMLLAQVWVNVRLNSWRNDFYNTLKEYDKPGFFYQLGIFIVIAMGSLLLSVYQTYLQQQLQIRWRRWMTNVYLHEWLADQTYYRLQLTSDATDNPAPSLIPGKAGLAAAESPSDDESESRSDDESELAVVGK